MEITFEWGGIIKFLPSELIPSDREIDIKQICKIMSDVGKYHKKNSTGKVAGHSGKVMEADKF